MSVFKKNVGFFDRALRGLMGIALVSFGLFGHQYLGEPLVQVLLVLFGGINLFSWVTGWCPVYSLASISTVDRSGA